MPDDLRRVYLPTDIPERQAAEGLRRRVAEPIVGQCVDGRTGSRSDAAAKPYPKPRRPLPRAVT